MRKRTAAWMLAGVMAVSLGSAGSVWAEAEENGVIKDVSYIDDGDEFHMADLYGIDGSEEKKPVIVEVHGGSYIGGAKEINSAHSSYYADHGFAVVNTNYTTMSHGGFKEVVQDLNAVLNWVEDNASEYGFDTEHVFMSGDSAGGYFVTLMATVLNSEELQDYYEITVPEFTVDGFVLTCPASDIPALAAALNEEGSMASKIAERIGEAVLGDQDIVDHADLYTIIDAETFPEVYILTTPDDEVLYTESLKLHEYLDELGIDHSYTEYNSEENQLEHVFNIGHVDWAESIQANDDSIAYLQAKCE